MRMKKQQEPLQELEELEGEWLAEPDQSPEEAAQEPPEPVAVPATAQMALDLVEVGNDDEDSHGKKERVTRHLPSGVTSKMLYSDIIRIAWPSMVELTLTQLASMVDLMMVGRLGPWAISAVGLTTQPKFLMMTVFQAMNVGATAMVARYKGADMREKANEILRQSMLLTFVFSMLASIIGYIFAEPLVRFMGAADAQTLAGGTVYLQIQMMGFVFMALTTTATAALRGVGNSRTAMEYNLIANLVNVVFNYMLIYGNFGMPRMEVAGASLATVIGQCVAFVLAFYSLMNGKQYLHLRMRDSFKPDFKAIGNITNIGIPAMIEQLVMRAGIITYSKTVASLGTVAFATHQVCMNIQSLSFMNGQAFAVSATSLTGQSLGKKRPDMAQAYSSRTSRIGMVVSAVIAITFFLFSKQIVGLYSDDPVVIAQGARILKFVALVQPFQASQFILAGALRGAGDTKVTAAITFVTVLLVRPGMAILAIYVFHWGLEGAWIALVCDQVLRTTLVHLRYRSGRWKMVKVNQ